MKQHGYEGKDLEAMSFATNYYRWVVDEFSQFLSGRVGEVGAGSGNFSSLLLDTKTETLVAIEPSQEMYPLLLEKFNNDEKVTCRQAIFADVYTEYTNYFDALVYVNVLEHIEDDRRELDYIHRALKSGGSLCIFVPALPWLYSDFDASIGHYRRYYKKELREMLEEAGFTVVKIRYFDILGVIPWFIFFTLFHKRLGTGGTRLYDRLVVPFAWIIESWCPIPVGKNIIVIAQKQ